MIIVINTSLLSVKLRIEITISGGLPHLLKEVRQNYLYIVILRQLEKEGKIAPIYFSNIKIYMNMEFPLHCTAFKHDFDVRSKER